MQHLSSNRSDEMAKFFEWVTVLFFMACLVQCQSSSYHMLAAAEDRGWNILSECMIDTSDQSTDSYEFGHDIGVRCCNIEGTEGYSPECLRPATYAQALEVCESRGYRLCTEDEVLVDRLGHNTGCSFNGLLIWTSTVCNCDNWACGGTTAAPTSAPTLCHPESVTAVNWHETV